MEVASARTHTEVSTLSGVENTATSIYIHTLSSNHSPLLNLNDQVSLYVSIYTY